MLGLKHEIQDDFCLKINTKNLELSDSEKLLINDKLEKLSDFLPSYSNIDFHIRTVHRTKYEVTLKVTSLYKTFQTREVGFTLEEVLKKTNTKILAQVRKWHRQRFSN